MYDLCKRIGKVGRECFACTKVKINTRLLSMHVSTKYCLTNEKQKYAT